MALMKQLKEWYEQKYKILMLIPFILVLLALLQIGVQYAQTGDVVHKGISLKGGSIITIPYTSDMAVDDLEVALQQSFPLAEISIRTITKSGTVTRLAIDSDAQERTEINTLLASLKQQGIVHDDKYSVEIIGSSLGESFFVQTASALLISFLLMGIVVFFYFRKLIPSAAVVLAAFSDITVTLAIFNLTGQTLGPGGVAAFLMLVGYSVDTDMLLSVRVLKRHEGSVMDRIYSSITTGLTMTATSLAAVVVTLLFVQNDTVRQIMFILCIGLVVDPIMTWIQNVGLLRWYLEKKDYEKNHGKT